MSGSGSVSSSGEDVSMFPSGVTYCAAMLESGCLRIIPARAVDRFFCAGLDFFATAGFLLVFSCLLFLSPLALRSVLPFILRAICPPCYCIDQFDESLVHCTRRLGAVPLYSV